MMDLALAAQAAGEDVEMCHSLAASAVDKDYSVEVSAREGVWELPSVDDLEVAAMAAAAALESMQQQQQQGNETESDESSEEDEDSSEEEEEDSDDDADDDVPTKAVAVPTKGGGLTTDASAASATVQLHMSLHEGDSAEPQVSVELRVVDGVSNPAGTGAPVSGAGSGDVVMDGGDDGETAVDSSSEEEEDSSSSEEEEEEEVLNYEEMSTMIEKAYEQADEPMEVGMAALVKELGLDHLPELEAKLEEGEQLEVAGTISAVVDGMLVVQGPTNKPALLEGTTLFMEDRTAVGVVEDVFGPVLSPWYALRWAAKGPMPASLAKGVILYSTPRLTSHVLPAEMYKNVAKAKPVDVEEEEEEEMFFSDDEAEAEYLKQKAADTAKAGKGVTNDRRRKRDQNSKGAPNGKSAHSKGATTAPGQRFAKPHASGFVPGFLNGPAKGSEGHGGRRPRSNRRPQNSSDSATNPANSAHQGNSAQPGGTGGYKQPTSSALSHPAMPPAQQGFNLFGPTSPSNFAPNSTPSPAFGNRYPSRPDSAPVPHFGHPQAAVSPNAPHGHGANHPNRPFTFGDQPTPSSSTSWTNHPPASGPHSHPSHMPGAVGPIPSHSWPQPAPPPGGPPTYLPQQQHSMPQQQHSMPQQQHSMPPQQHSMPPQQHSMPPQQPHPGHFNGGRPSYPANHSQPMPPNGFHHGPPGHPPAFGPGAHPQTPAGFAPQGSQPAGFMPQGVRPPQAPPAAPWPGQGWQ